MSFLLLLYSTTSLSTAHSGCSTEKLDSTSSTSEGQRDSSYCLRNPSPGGGVGEGVNVGELEDEMGKFLLGSGWVRVYFTMCILIRWLEHCTNRMIPFIDSTITGFRPPNA
jgi:hypothetical protein